MRHGFDPVFAGELGDPQPFGDPTAALTSGCTRSTWPRSINSAEAPASRVLLPGGNADLDRVGELGIGLVLIRFERLLQPEDPDLLELPRDADR